MANHKSALKRNKQSQVRRDRNRANKTRVKSAIKAVDLAITEAASAENAQQALVTAVPIIQGAAVKGVFHKKTASRKVSRLTKRVNNFVKDAQSTT